MNWRHSTLQPLGDATVQITVEDPAEYPPEPGNAPTGLLTVRCKDQDLTAEQFEAFAEACTMAAKRLRGVK